MKDNKKEIPVSLTFSLCLAMVIIVFVFSSDISKGVISLASTGENFTQETKTSIKVNNSGTAFKAPSIQVSGFGSGKKETGSDTDTPSDILKLMENAKPLYSKYKKTGDIEETQFGSGAANTKYGNIYVNNRTDVSCDIKALLNTKPSYGKITKSKPYILIYHTHTTEGYELLSKGWYSDDYNSRTNDTGRTVVRVGDEIEKELVKAGYGVIHDKKIYDSTYNGAYSRSYVTVQKVLKENPSIVITLDVHRDAIHYDDGTKCKPTAVIDGKKAAQVMIITGCEENGITDFPNWKQNLVFSVALQNKVEELYSGLMRPIFFCDRQYNMEVTPCSLLLEFGTDANTLEEAVYSGKLIGKSLARLLDENM